ncbi:MAG: glycosyltransferase family 1 protein [Microgenomates group bacterium]
MRVLLDTSPINTEHGIRGIGVYTRTLAEALENLEGVEVIRSAALQKNSKPIVDLIHYPFFDFFFTTLPLFRRAPTIVTIHDVIPLKYPKNYPAGIKGSIRSKIQQFNIKTVQAIITDSRHSKNDILKYFQIPSEKIHVVQLAANPTIQRPTNKEIQNVLDKYQLPEKYVLYVGDINFNKNIPQLIKSIRYLPSDIHLVCLGKNFREQEIHEWEVIEQQIALSDVRERVHFMPSILSEATIELSAIYSGAQAYIQPSIDEGFGLPILEAMICKTPVVCTELGSLPEVAGVYAFYSSDSSAEALSEATKRAISQTKKARSEFVEDAFKWANQFSWQKTALDTRAVYEKVIQSTK